MAFTMPRQQVSRADAKYHRLTKSDSDGGFIDLQVIMTRNISIFSLKGHCLKSGNLPINNLRTGLWYFYYSVSLKYDLKFSLARS